MTMSEENSFDNLLVRLELGRRDAQTEVFHRFAGRLIQLARARLLLILAARTALSRVLNLMGMSAPEEM